jgi:threonylcarbamoyladenosine tRNA methylthiotransferase MtaB
VIQACPQTRRAALHTLGCRLNQSETLIIRQRLMAAGYSIVPFGQPADLGIINTCTVTNLADAKSRRAIRSFTRRNPEAFTAVVGCYSESGASAIASIPGVDLIIGNQDKLAVLDFIDGPKNPEPVIIRERIDRDDFSIHQVGELPYNKRANLKVQDGCNFMCDFCIIPFVRGRARARNWSNLLEEARSLAERGVRELVLTGVNIGTYDSGGRTIVDVVDALDRVPGIDRIRISSIEPTTVPDEVLDRMGASEHRLMPFLHLPLQSGVDSVLRAMRRRYTVAEYTEQVRLAHDRVPDLYLGTDIMVGHPSESEADFEQTCAFIAEQSIAFAHVFPYSERDGTLAARRIDRVPIQERSRRSAVLRNLAARKRLEFYRTHLGQTLPVLFEDPKPDCWPGYTANYVRVVLPRDPHSDNDLANHLIPIRLESVEADYVRGVPVTV